LDVDEEVKAVLGQVLRLGDVARNFDESTALFGAIAEFDSMAVVTVITTLEERFDITVEDSEVTAEVFETVGSLTRFVQGKLAA
jgi:acyl carrier protein